MKIYSQRKFLHLLAVLLVAGTQSVYADIVVGAPFMIAGAGIYKGSYSSNAAGGDYGTVTIIIADNGSTACDFHSTPNDTDVITTGGLVTSNSPYMALTCTSAEISFGGSWGAVTDASSITGQSLSGTWTRVTGVSTGSGPTGTFKATFASALKPIDPAAITGLWYQPGLSDGGFNFLFADSGLLVTYMGVTTWSTTYNGQPTGVPLGTPYWMISAVGPKTVVPGTSFSLNLFAAPNPPPAQTGVSGVTPAGSLKVTFFDCKLATATLSGSTFVSGNISWSLHKLAGVANGPGC